MSCSRLMLEGGRRQLPASFLPLLSCLCSLSPDKVAGGKQQQQLGQRWRSALRRWGASSDSLELLLHGQANKSLPLRISSAWLPTPMQGPPSKACAPCSSLPLLFLLPYPPLTLAPCHLPELGVKSSAAGRVDSAQFPHNWLGPQSWQKSFCLRPLHSVSLKIKMFHWFSGKENQNKTKTEKEVSKPSRKQQQDNESPFQLVCLLFPVLSLVSLFLFFTSFPLIIFSSYFPISPSSIYALLCNLVLCPWGIASAR